MSVMKCLAVLIIPVSVVIYLISPFLLSEPLVPDDDLLADGWWASDDQPTSGSSSSSTLTDEAIRPFTVNVSKEILDDLRIRLQNTRLSKSLPGTNFESGIHSDYMKTVVEYWKNSYDWRKQEKIINSFPQYMTMIEGISVHFIRVKSDTKAAKGKKNEPVMPTSVTPLLIVHGWPGSFWEFHKIIPILLEKGAAGKIAFELIIPSIPGYSFSEAAHRPGFDLVDAARVFNKLMSRLGHERYYVQGGDWGAGIVKAMARLYPSNVLGLHVNFSPPPRSLAPVLRRLLGAVVPSLVYTESEIETIDTPSEQLSFLWRELGYFHLQSTRPDTVSYALNDSPVGLAAYILEKFSVWTHKKNRFCPDGCIKDCFTLDELLTNVMIYWVTGSIGSSVRFYMENFSSSQLKRVDGMPVHVPTGVASFPHEPLLHIESQIRADYGKQLVQYTVLSEGGHFAALEQPRLLADDICNFLTKVQTRIATSTAGGQ